MTKKRTKSMTLDREAGMFEAACDCCGECFPTNIKDGGRHDAQSFQQAISYLKNNGWKIYKEGNEWQHKCPDCCTNKRYGEG